MKSALYVCLSVCLSVVLKCDYLCVVFLLFVVKNVFNLYPKASCVSTERKILLFALCLLHCDPLVFYALQSFRQATFRHYSFTEYARYEFENFEKKRGTKLRL